MVLSKRLIQQERQEKQEKQTPLLHISASSAGKAPLHLCPLCDTNCVSNRGLSFSLHVLPK